MRIQCVEEVKVLPAELSRRKEVQYTMREFISPVLISGVQIVNSCFAINDSISSSSAASTGEIEKLKLVAERRIIGSQGAGTICCSIHSYLRH